MKKPTPSARLAGLAAQLRAERRGPYGTLFIVSRRPLHRFRDMYNPFFWFTHATSATAAVRKARELLPSAFGPDSRYVAPHARRVVPGGPVWVA
jgi:hypothetical protein